MSSGVLGLTDRFGTLWLSRLLLVGVVVGSLSVTSGHDLYTAFIQHRVHLTLGARHVDLTLDLTFFEEWSSLERGRMDADGNGRISRAEVDIYLKKNSPEWLKQVRLFAAGRELALTPLYEGEVDLLGTDRAGPAHHRLRLYFFAPTPKGLRSGDDLLVQSELWAKAKGLAVLHGEGRDSCELQAEEPGNPSWAPAQAGDTRQFKFRCLTPPRPTDSHSTGSTPNSPRD